MKVINLFAGPGAGKSTTAAGLFYLMKRKGLNVELIDEYAKDATWDDNKTQLQDQLYITASQNRKIWRLRDKVDWVVCDSPLLLGLHYVTPDYFPGSYTQFVYELWDHYDNVNFFIKRTKKYNPIGRNQTEEEARQLDINIKNTLIMDRVDFTEVEHEPQLIINSLAEAKLI